MPPTRSRSTLTAPWLDAVAPIGARLGVAVVHGLLIGAVASGHLGPATEAFERFVTMWSNQHDRPVTDARSK